MKGSKPLQNGVKHHIANEVLNQASQNVNQAGAEYVIERNDLEVREGTIGENRLGGSTASVSRSSLITSNNSGRLLGTTMND